MAEVKVPYQVNDRQFAGMIVYGDTVQRKRPVVFMQPDWKGVCADTVAQTHAVAGEDYVVLMAECSAPTAIRPRRASNLQRECGQCTRTSFSLSPGALIDETKKLAVGYCASGGFVLEQARAGADLKAVVVLHVKGPGDPWLPRIR